MGGGGGGGGIMSELNTPIYNSADHSNSDTVHVVRVSRN